MKHHFRHYGAIYILALLFLGSWIGQFFAMLPTIRESGMTEFWASTFENWQSEWLQLVFQALFLMVAKHIMFRAEGEEEERIEAKLDEIIKRIERESHQA